MPKSILTVFLVAFKAGRGIAMARLGVDELTYEHLDGTNVWRLLRRRASRG